jgi:hypothetical protein
MEMNHCTNKERGFAKAVIHGENLKIIIVRIR